MFIVINLDVILHNIILVHSMCSHPRSPADGQHKCHMKRCLEFEKNAASHMTFVGQLTCQP